MNLYYTAENTRDVVEQGMLVFYEDPGVADFSKASEIQKSEYSASRDRYMASSYGIPAKEMGDERYYCAYARLTDGTYVYSKLYGYSPKQYAMNRLERSDDDALKALCAAMLNYGASAQKYFGYRTDNLMNKDLTDAQKALFKAYDASLFTGAVAVESPEFANFSSTNSGFSYKSASVSFDGTFGINYYLMPTGDVQGTLDTVAEQPVLSADYEGSDRILCQIIGDRYIPIVQKGHELLLLVQRIPYCILQFAAFFGMDRFQPCKILLQKGPNHILAVIFTSFDICVTLTARWDVNRSPSDEQNIVFYASGS